MALQVFIHPVTKAERLWVPPGHRTAVPTHRTGLKLHSGPQASIGASPRQVQSGAMPYFEALSESPDRTPIPNYASALRFALLGFNRQRLAALGRYLYDNDGWVGLSVDQIANYSAPITPMAATANPDWNKLADAYFADWAKRADYSGRFDFDTLQRLVCKAIDTDGDIGVLMVLESGFPQIQLVESWRINSGVAADRAFQGFDGVQVSKTGVLLGFYVDEKAAPISANEMLLLYDPERYSAYRGLSPLRRGMNDIRDAKDIKGFEKLATKIASMLAAVIESEGPVESNVWGDDQAPENKPPEDATEEEKNLGVAELLGGDIPILTGGQKLHQLDNNRPGERVLDMLNYLGGCFMAGLGVPPAFFIDEKLTGPNQRSVNGKAQRKFNTRQTLLAGMVEWVRLRVIAQAIDSGALPGQDGWPLMEWQGPPKVTIDEGKDQSEWREQVATGLMSRQEFFSNRALNWMRETDQSFNEDDYILARASEQAKKFKVPIETILTRWGFEAKAAPPKPTDPKKKPQPKEEEE